MPFYDQHFIPFHLGDPAGMLFFGQLFPLMHQAYEQCVIKKLGIAWTDWFQNEEWIVPIKQVEAKFFSPIYVGRTANSVIELAELKNSSFILNTHFHQSDLQCASIMSIHVFCDRQKLVKRDIPEAIRSAFINF